MPTPSAHRKILSLATALGLGHADDAAVRLLEDPRRSAHERRLDDRQVVDDLGDPSVDRRREADRDLRRQEDLAERVRHRQPEELQVVLGEELAGEDDRTFVRPAVVAQAYALGPAGGAGRVDQGRERAGLRRGHSILDDRGVLLEVLLAQLLEIVEADDPVAVGRALEHHDLDDRRQLGVLLAELGDLLVVLGEHDPAVGVGEDVGDVVGHRRRVDRGRGSACGDDRQVSEDPLEPRAGRDRDPLFGLDAQRHQSGGEARHAFAGLGPGQRVPVLVLVGIAVGLARTGLLDPGEERGAHAGGPVIDDLKLFWSGRR